MTRALSLAVAIPATIVIVIFAASGAVALVNGKPLLWPAQDVTLTEAVGMRDTAEIVRQIALGADPNARFDTWDVLKRYQHVFVTPLEAAVATRELYLFNLIVAHGGVVTVENARTLQCFAVQEHATEIASVLSKQFAPPESCTGVALPW